LTERGLTVKQYFIIIEVQSQGETGMACGVIRLGSGGFSLTSGGEKGILWELEGFCVSVLTGRAELETKV